MHRSSHQPPAEPNGTPDEWSRQVLAFLTGEMPDAERATFEAARDADPARREEFAEIQGLWAAVAQDREFHHPSRDLWPGVRQFIVDEWALTRAVREATGESASDATHEGTSPTARPESDIARRQAEFAPDVRAVFATIDESPALTPSRDLFAAIRARAEADIRAHTGQSAPPAAPVLRLIEDPTDSAAASLAHFYEPPAGRFETRLALIASIVGVAAAALVFAITVAQIAPFTPDSAGNASPIAGGNENAPHTPEHRPDAPPPNNGANTPGTPGTNGGNPIENVDANGNQPSNSPPQPDTNGNGGTNGHAVDNGTPDGGQSTVDNGTNGGNPSPDQNPHLPATISSGSVTRFEMKTFAEEPPFELAVLSHVVLPAGHVLAELDLPTLTGTPILLERGHTPDSLRVAHSSGSVLRSVSVVRGEGIVRVVLSARGEPSFAPFGLPYDIFFAFDKSTGDWRARPACAMVSTSRVAGHTLLLVDGNFNGTFNDIGADFIASDGDRQGLKLHHVLRLGNRLVEARITHRGTAASFTAYAGPTGLLTVDGHFRNGVMLESVRLRSEHCELRLDAGDVGRDVPVPAGRFVLIDGQVGDGEHHLRIENLGVMPYGLSTYQIAVNDRGTAPPEEVAIDVPAGEAGSLVFGGPLRLIAELPRISAPHELFALSTAQVILLGAAGEKYTGRLGSPPEPIAPRTADLVERDLDSWWRVMPGEFRYSANFDRTFLILEFNPHWQPRGPLALQITEDRFSRFLTGEPLSATFLLH